MGLTKQSTGINVLTDVFNIKKNPEKEKVIALAGNPNVGKSTVFNSLTGLNQHTGNWPGKTVTNAQGKYSHKDNDFILVDIPGTYSLMSSSVEEEVARDFICFGNPDATIVVVDATCIERNLNLVLQILEMTGKVVVCVNLMDEAKRKKIRIDLKEISKALGVPVIGTTARNGEGLDELMDAVYEVSNDNEYMEALNITYCDAVEEAVAIVENRVKELVDDNINSRWVSLKLIDGESTILNSLNNFLGFDLLQDEILNEKINAAWKLLKEHGIDYEGFRDEIVSRLVAISEHITRKAVTYENKQYNIRDRKIDKILTSKAFGIPIMIAMLGVIFWITIVGANYPSSMISDFLFAIEEKLSGFFLWLGVPQWIHDLIVFGMYRTLAWVVSVMFPPMAIFFPLFTLMEDIGYLPRIAFNLDNFFKKACAHGKQALTMCMGFGCNAAGVIGCRIIDSPRERLIATITNNFVPCNGRFPTLIAISTIFIGSGVMGFSSVISALSVVCVIVLGIFMTLFMSKLLSKTILKGVPSSFTLELPPYRRPQIGRVIIRSLLDRTIFVLGRAVVVAAPAGIVIWLMANINVNGTSLLMHCASFLDPFARLIGLDGVILMAFILGLPANEIVIPIIIMAYMSNGSMMELESLYELKDLLISRGWTFITAICVMLFSLMHFPCATTLWTIGKETRSVKWTLLSFVIPTASGIIICFVITTIARLFGLA